MPQRLRALGMRRLARSLGRAAPARPAALIAALLTVSRAFLIAAPIAAFVTAGDAAADTLDDIRKRGKVLVGVKADYAPYGYLNEDRRIVGLEPELARDIADLLGVDLELVAVTASGLQETLEQGKIDLLLATLADTPARREAMRVVDPNYYAAGINILTKGSFASWDELEGDPLCSLLGAFYDREPVRRFGTDVVGFKTTAEALTALKQNRCVAFIYDDTFIRARLAEPDWEGWRMPLPSVDERPWALAVRKDDKALAALLGGLVVNWHLTGRILRLEQKHGVTPTDFPKRMHDVFAAINLGVER